MFLDWMDLLDQGMAGKETVSTSRHKINYLSNHVNEQLKKNPKWRVHATFDIAWSVHTSTVGFSVREIPSMKNSEKQEIYPLLLLLLFLTSLHHNFPKIMGAP
jgi:hypothetical protein